MRAILPGQKKQDIFLNFCKKKTGMKSGKKASPKGTADGTKSGRMIHHPPVRHRGSLCRDAVIDRGNIITKEELLLTLCFGTEKPYLLLPAAYTSLLNTGSGWAVFASAGPDCSSAAAGYAVSDRSADSDCSDYYSGCMPLSFALLSLSLLGEPSPARYYHAPGGCGTFLKMQGRLPFFIARLPVRQQDG